MPELPEVEAVARLIGAAVAGAEVRSVRAAAVSTLKSFDPPVNDLVGCRLLGVGRRGKHLIVEFDHDLRLLIHLMSAGRFQLWDKAAGPRDRTSRFLVDLSDGRQLRLREFGTRQSAWIKVLRAGELDRDEALAKIGPDAWPDPPELGPLLDQPRPLNALLRDQRVIAGIGRSWADEILHRAMLSPFKRGRDLDPGQLTGLRTAVLDVLGEAISYYDSNLELPVPDKLPMPLRIHHRTGHPCPRCGTAIQAVYFEDHEMCYCPACQTGGKSLKDRRMSRLLK